jgi:hypothetical protein
VSSSRFLRHRPAEIPAPQLEGNPDDPSEADAEPTAELADDPIMDYQITISMSAATVTALIQSNYYLYGFKAVQSGDKAGRPLAWFQTQGYSASTVVTWTDQVQAYTSSSPIVQNGIIHVGYSTAISLGQILQVQAGGIGDVVGGGSPTAVSILNQTSTQFTCGISSPVYGSVNPVCAFPLYGNGLQGIVPLEQVLLMFSTLSIPPGSVIGPPSEEALSSPQLTLLDAYSQGIMIDMTDAPGNARSVSYDINTGWSWGGYSWAQQVPAGTNLVPLLIESSS